MNEFNARFQSLSASQRQERYASLARACLAHYPATNGEVTFVAHNAGITYRVDSMEGAFLLKIAQATGDGLDRTRPDPLNSVFIWLDAIARETPLIVQNPVANGQGAFVTEVVFEDLSEPFYCSIQRWLEGEHPRNPSPTQAFEIGRMTSVLHTHGSQWILGNALEAWQYDEGWLRENFQIFTKVKTLSILSKSEWMNVENAFERIIQVMQRLGKEPTVWGPIHSDLHQQNLLIYRGQICPIDFGGLILGHYGYDLGVTLYHFMYLDALTRQNLIQGYRTNRELVGLSEMDLEAFLCAAALANLAFNVELPDQRTSKLFIRNLHEFATIFCEKLIHDIPFALESYNYVH